MTTFNLKETMERRNISIKELSEGTGLSRNTISLITRNKTNGINFSTLDAIMEYLNCSIFDVIKVKHEKEQSLVEFKSELIKFINKED